MNFTQFNLDPRLMQGVKKAGYETATPIQEAAMPAALRGRDIIGTAQTGTGKTAAFVLPILNKLISGGQRNVPRALIVAPTRELAEQINDVIKVLAAGTKLKSATIYGGVGANPQIQALRSGAEILVALGEVFLGDDLAAAGDEGFLEELGEAEAVGVGDAGEDGDLLRLQVLLGELRHDGALEGVNETDAEDVVAGLGDLRVGGRGGDHRDLRLLGDGGGLEGAPVTPIYTQAA